MYGAYQDSNSGKPKPKTRTILLAAGLLALLGVGIWAVAHFMGGGKAPPLETAEAAPGIVYDTAAVEGGWSELSQKDIEAKLNEKVAESMISISMNVAPIFENSQAEGNLMIVNELTNNYPQKVEIVRNDTGEKIYESGAIPVGSKIERGKLLAELEAGEYACTAYFHSLDPETGAILGTAGAVITLTIQN